MSDYLDILKSAAEQGITLDSCGTDERQKWWGLYSDLCGMSVEDAMAVQFDHENGGVKPSKETNVITFAMESSGDQYELVLSAAKAPTSTVTVTCTIDGESKSLILPAGAMKLNTGIFKPTKYATITDINFATGDEAYKYEASNMVQDGKFTLTYMLNGSVYKTESVVYNTTVTVLDTPADYKVGYDFTWKNEATGEILGNEFIMPENNVTIIGNAIVHVHVLKYSYDGIELEDGEISVAYNTVINSLPVIKDTGKTGYDFISWKTVGGENLPSKMPDNDIEIVGTFKIREHNLFFSIDGKLDSGRTEIHKYGEEIDSSKWADPEKEGYTFIEWTDVPATMPDNDVTVTAKFNINTYTISYTLTKEGVNIPVADSEFEFNQAIVLEKIPAELAEKVTKEISIPTIGIGAGGGTDGQVLVFHDIMGINKDFSPRFLRRYADLFSVITDAAKHYIEDVKSNDFPNEKEQY